MEKDNTIEWAHAVTKICNNSGGMNMSVIGNNAIININNGNVWTI